MKPLIVICACIVLALIAVFLGRQMDSSFTETREDTIPTTDRQNSFRVGNPTETASPDARISDESLPSIRARENVASTESSSLEATSFPPQQRPVVPVAILPEIEPLMDAAVTEIHSELEQEDIDSVWSPTMEANLRAYFSSNVEFLQAYRSPAITCRASLCEVQAVADGPGAPNWMQFSRQIFDQAWASGFEGAPLGHGIKISAHNEATTVIWFLKRRGGPAQPGWALDRPTPP